MGGCGDYMMGAEQEVVCLLIFVCRFERRKEMVKVFRFRYGADVLCDKTIRGLFLFPLFWGWWLRGFFCVAGLNF